MAVSKQVSLSDNAYAALKREKKEGESFSDLCTRLLRESRVTTKDPMAFARFPHKFLLTTEEHLREVEEGRRNDRDPWADEERRQSQLRAKKNRKARPAPQDVGADR